MTERKITAGERALAEWLEGEWTYSSKAEIVEFRRDVWPGLASGILSFLAAHASETDALLEEALRKIAAIGHGLELGDTLKEREHYWRTAALRYQKIARDTLAKLDNRHD